MIVASTTNIVPSSTSDGRSTASITGSVGMSLISIMSSSDIVGSSIRQDISGFNTKVTVTANSLSAPIKWGAVKVTGFPDFSSPLKLKTIPSTIPSGSSTVAAAVKSVSSSTLSGILSSTVGTTGTMRTFTSASEVSVKLTTFSAVTLTANKVSSSTSGAVNSWL